MKIKSRIIALSLALALGCGVIAACTPKNGGSPSNSDASSAEPASSGQQQSDESSSPADVSSSGEKSNPDSSAPQESSSAPQESSSAPGASSATSASQPATSSSQPSGSSSTPSSSSSAPQVLKYKVNYTESADYTIEGINPEGYEEGATVTFKITMVNEDKEIVSVYYDQTVLTPKDNGNYEFKMPKKNVTLGVRTKAVVKYALSHTGTIRVDGDAIPFTLTYGNDPVTTFTLEAAEGADKVSIDGHNVTGIAEGDAVIAAKVDGKEVARESVKVERSAYYTIAEAISDAWSKGGDFADNSKNSKSADKYKIKGKLVFVGNPSSGRVETLIDDGTGILDYQITSSSPLSTIAVGDVIEIEEQITNYYGLMEATSTAERYAKKLTGVEMNTTSFTTLESASAFDDVYDATLVNEGIHKITPVVVDAKAKTVEQSTSSGGTETKKRYEIDGAKQGLLATSKSAIELAHVEGATYTFKGYLLSWNDNYKYSNLIAVEQTKMAATSVALDQEDFELAINASKQLTYTVQPLDAGRVISWSSDKPNIVSVDNKGVISANAVGQARVTVNVDGQEDSVNVTVVQPIPATSANFSVASKTIVKAETLDLNDLLTVEPAENSDTKNRQWSVAPEGILSVEDGVVTPITTGTATVTVKYNDSVSASIEITVRDQKLADLADAKVDDPVDVYGYVTGKYPVDNKYGLWIGDGDYGAYLHHGVKEGMVEGAIVHVVGKVGANNGSKQITATSYEVVESYQGLTTPSTLTIDDTIAASIDASYQGRKGIISGTVTANTVSSSGHRTVTVKIGEKSFKAYVHAGNCGSAVVDDFARAGVGKTVTISGYITANKSNVTDFTKLSASDYQLINPTLVDVQSVEATGLKLNKETANVKQGETLQLTVEATPVGADLPGDVTWEVTGNDKVTVDNKGLVTVAADAVADSTATVKAKSGTLEATCVITVKSSATAVDNSKIVFGDLGLENGTKYSDPFEGDDFTITFGGGGNDGKYYTTGSGIRTYGDGYFTIASSRNILKVVLTWDGSNKPADGTVVNEGTYDAETGIWTGSSKSIVFTRPTGSGHWRLQSVEVFYVL